MLQTKFVWLTRETFEDDMILIEETKIFQSRQFFLKWNDIFFHLLFNRIL